MVLGAGRDALAAMICIRFSIHLEMGGEKPDLLHHPTPTAHTSRPKSTLLQKKSKPSTPRCCAGCCAFRASCCSTRNSLPTTAKLTAPAKSAAASSTKNTLTSSDKIYGGKRDILIDCRDPLPGRHHQHIRTTLRVVARSRTRDAWECGGGGGMGELTYPTRNRGAHWGIVPRSLYAWGRAASLVDPGSSS